MPMKRSKFNLSHYRLQTADMGYLTPISCVEVLPGDTFRHRTTMLIRLSPLVAPVMHPVHVRVHSWFVPNRLVWSDWEAFITKRLDTTVPTINRGDKEGSVLDYLGVPGAGTGDSYPVSALPVRAYNLIWNEFYRDQDLQDERGQQAANSLARVAWEKDYFTTARPEPQMGPEGIVSFSVGTAPVHGLAIGASSATFNVGSQFPDPNADDPTGGRIRAAVANADAGVRPYADLSQSDGGFTINDFRRAMALQRMAEHRNRFGSRYTDYLRYLGVTPSDARLQRPEFLGGGRQTVSFSEVLSTADSGNASVGSMAGHGIAAVRTRPWRKFFEEHGYVITLAFVRPKAIYGSGVERTFLRQTADDFWQKENEAMGDQEVFNREVKASHASPNGTFGFVPRYDDYRRQWSNVAAGMRTSVWDAWHLARMFENSDPALNSTFVSCDPTTRIFADTNNEATMQWMASHDISARRLVARSGVK